jgi:hypothetical protein
VSRLYQAAQRLPGGLGRGGERGGGLLLFRIYPRGSFTNVIFVRQTATYLKGQELIKLVNLDQVGS